MIKKYNMEALVMEATFEEESRFNFFSAVV